MIEVAQALRHRLRHLTEAGCLPQVGVDQWRKGPTLDLGQDRLPVGTTLQQIRDALEIGMRSRAGLYQAVFKDKRRRKHGNYLRCLYISTEATVNLDMARQAAKGASRR